MAEERVLSVAPSIVDPVPHTKPQPTRSGLGLEFVYSPSDDGVDENLLIVLHGLGDTMTPFVRMAKQLKLPQTATLVLQAPDLYVPVPHFYHDFIMNLQVPAGSRSRASTTAIQPTPTPPGLSQQNRRSLGVIDERPRRDSGGNNTPTGTPLSTYARILAKFRRQASEGHVPVSVPIGTDKTGPSTVRPRRTLRKRTSSIRPTTPPHNRPPLSNNSTQLNTTPSSSKHRISPVRRTTSPVPFNPPNIQNPNIPSNAPPPAPIPVPTPVPAPRRPQTGTNAANAAEMHRPSSPPATRQNLKTWWKQFKNAQGAILKRDPDELVKNAPHTVFGIPLRESLRYASVQISTANPQGELYVWGYIPVVVAKCGLFLKENATEVEGVFRINGSNKRMRDLQSIFESPPRYGKDLNWKHESYTSHDVASVFRRYLTQMPEPVIPTEQYHAFRAALGASSFLFANCFPMLMSSWPSLLANRSKGENEVIQTYRKLIKEMPRANQYLLLYVLDLLSVFARKSEKNLMTESNLAVIFRPGIISFPAHEMKPTEHALSQQVLVFLIQHQDHFMLDPPARGDSIMLSSGMSPGIERGAYLSSHPGQFSPGVERPGYIVPSDSDEDPPPGGYKMVERRRDLTTGSLARRRSFHDPGTNLGPLTTEPESIGSESPVTTESGGVGKVKRSRTVPSQRGTSVLESNGGSKRRTKRLDTLGSVGSTAESGIASTLSGVGGSAIERDSAPTPTSSTMAVVNATPPADRPSTS
ncbi:unnamed protein product [Rhizoctonia solani]|uniref:Rho-GAP domain-containing protein n=1 Tax=Rhizoctonia solani TaxID=456999 RepID=A0A8H3AFF0_9AGAM|nr:unnamed protein product [Rhizoctonia solani]